jgi:hypothetical protein
MNCGLKFDFYFVLLPVPKSLYLGVQRFNLLPAQDLFPFFMTMDN